MFKNYDNGWKWLKMMGMVSFVAMIVLLVSESAGFADIGIIGRTIHCLEEMNSKVKKAAYLKNVQYKLNKPPWMEN